jgi:hypothetical protein
VTFLMAQDAKIVERIGVVGLYRQSFLVTALRQIALTPLMVRASLFDKRPMDVSSHANPSRADAFLHI